VSSLSPPFLLPAALFDYNTNLALIFFAELVVDPLDQFILDRPDSRLREPDAAFP